MAKNFFSMRWRSKVFRCRYGGCISCAAKLIEDEVNQSEGVALKPYQLAEGYVLLCVARLMSDFTFDVGVEIHDKLYRNPFKDPISSKTCAQGLAAGKSRSRVQADPIR